MLTVPYFHLLLHAVWCPLLCFAVHCMLPACLAQRWCTAKKLSPLLLSIRTAPRAGRFLKDWIRKGWVSVLHFLQGVGDLGDVCS